MARSGYHKAIVARSCLFGTGHYQNNPGNNSNGFDSGCSSVDMGLAAAAAGVVAAAADDDDEYGIDPAAPAAERIAESIRDKRSRRTRLGWTGYILPYYFDWLATSVRGRCNLTSRCKL